MKEVRISWTGQGERKVKMMSDEGMLSQYDMRVIRTELKRGYMEYLRQERKGLEKGKKDGN